LLESFLNQLNLETGSAGSNQKFINGYLIYRPS